MSNEEYVAHRRNIVANSVYLHRYGLTVKQVEGMKKQRRGLCDICSKKPIALHIDHDHRTGRVRGLLCFNCNSAIGHFRDDPSLLEKAAEYLERYQ